MATTHFTSGTSDHKVVLRLYLFNIAQRRRLECEKLSVRAESLRSLTYVPHLSPNSILQHVWGAATSLRNGRLLSGIEFIRTIIFCKSGGAP